MYVCVYMCVGICIYIRLGDYLVTNQLNSIFLLCNSWFSSFTTVTFVAFINFQIFLHFFLFFLSFFLSFFLLFIYLLYCHLFPSPRGRHASWQEKSYSKRTAKLKKEKKNKISPLCPLSCRLGHKRTSILQKLHIAEATHSFLISSKSRVHPSPLCPTHSAL